MAFDIGDKTIQFYNRMDVAGPISILAGTSPVLATASITITNPNLYTTINPMVWAEGVTTVVNTAPNAVRISGDKSLNGGGFLPTHLDYVEGNSLFNPAAYIQQPLVVQGYMSLTDWGGAVIPPGATYGFTFRIRVTPQDVDVDAYVISVVVASFIEVI